MKKNYYSYITVLCLTFSLNVYSVPNLNSLPSATATIFLDFDGHTVSGSVWNAWNGGNPIYCQPAVLTNTQITEIFNRVAEDFRPFNINITTDSTVYLSKPLTMRNRIIITPTSAWCPGVGGTAYGATFAQNNDIPAFVFSDRLGPNSPKQVAECCSHEAGHTLGLAHQSRYDVSNCTYPIQEYNNGAGTGETGWSPIMGDSYYRNMTNWNNGQIPTGCTEFQDNLSILTSLNGFGYRPDDYTETLNASATALVGNNYSLNGIITTTTDRDAFRFSLNSNSNILLSVIPFNVGANYIGANLDVKLELYNSTGSLLRTYNPVANMGVTVDTVLSAGTYYWVVDGAGNINIGDYGSLGSYTLSGTSSALPIRSVVLTGNTNKGNHNLSWDIKADEAIKEIVIETSQNAIGFKSLASVNNLSKKFAYQPYQTNTIYYRLKVTSVVNQTVYSNTIALKSDENSDALFSVSTLVQDNIRVNASENYQYRLMDINGRQITSGNGVKGISSISVSAQAKGFYMLQLFANTKNQTERIIKQ